MGRPGYSMNEIIVQKIGDINSVSNQAPIFNQLNMAVTSVLAWKETMKFLPKFPRVFGVCRYINAA